MELIETLENKDLSIEEAKELLAKYEALYIEETDKELSDEYYYAAGVLEARLNVMMDMEENKDKIQKAFDDIIKELKNENDVLLKKIVNEGGTLLGKADIMIRFDKESGWALRFLKLMFQQNLGRKIGKEYFITKEEMEEFMKISKGKDFMI